jgi:hypothetical protein
LEFGYRNSDHATKEPWIESKNGINNLAQTNGCESCFKSLTKKGLVWGGFAWKWYADPCTKTRNSVDYTPQEKPALEVLKKWFIIIFDKIYTTISNNFFIVIVNDNFYPILKKTHSG